MYSERRPDRAELVALVEQIIAADFDTDDEVDAAVALFRRSVPHPMAADLIYYWEDAFDHEPTAVEIVDRALSYRAIEL